jgi:predicted dehydrogenase
MSKLAVGVIGCGYWGPNLIRNFSSCPSTQVVGVCDRDTQRLESIGRSHGSLQLTKTVDELLELNLDAVAIATPVSTHYELASRCLEAGLHVLVEKPLAANVWEAEQLTAIARRAGRILMVDHTYLYGNPVRRIKSIIESGELGDLYYIDSVRINLGLFQHDVNVIWDLAPHDLSIIDFILGWQARSVSSWGCAHGNPGVENIAYLNLDFGDRMLANVHVNWLSPVKIRQIIFGGSRKSLVFNDLNPTEPIKIYDRGVEFSPGDEARRSLQVGYRTGDVWSPHVEPGEALQAMVRHFAECIASGADPITSGEQGVRVVRYLEAATRSIRAQGGRIVLTPDSYSSGFANGHRNGKHELLAHRA